MISLLNCTWGGGEIARYTSVLAAIYHLAAVSTKVTDYAILRSDYT